MKMYVTSVFLLAATTSFANCSGGDSAKAVKTNTVVVADADNAGLKLPSGFGALKVAENVGRARHLTVTPQGNIYVKSSKLVDGKGILEVKVNANGKGEVVKSFGTFTGTGITICMLVAMSKCFVTN